MELYYFGARYYDAATGVWLTQDVYRGAVEQPLTLHRTLYALANPVNNVDAYGYRVIPNGYGDSGGGSTAVHPRDPTPNPARQDNHPYEWKPERDGSGGGGRRGRNGSGGGGRDEPEDEWGGLTRWLHDGRGLWGGLEPPEPEDEVPWWVKSMGAVAGSLQSIADPTRNPRTAAFHHAFWGGAKAWGDVFGMMQETSEYTGTAIAEGRWEDAIRGEQAILQESWELTKIGPKVAGQFVWGIITTPVRIFATDIPEFTGAVSERWQGGDRGWDVVFTGTMLAGDVSATYKFAKATGLVDRANRAAENYLSRETSVAYRDQIRAIMDKPHLSEADMARLEELVPKDIEQAGGTLIRAESGPVKNYAGDPGEPNIVRYTERPELFHEWLHFDADRQAGWPGVGEPVEYAPQEIEAYSWQLEHPEILGEHALPELEIRQWQTMLEYWERLLGSQ